MIKHVKALLEDEHLSECYDETTAESLVQYMYRWRLCSHKIFIYSEGYIKELLTLIPPESATH